MRITILTFFALAVVCSLSFAADSAGSTRPAHSSALLTDDEVKQIDKVVASILAAGFPDAHSAIVYSGKISVRATFDPTKRAMPLPSDASNMQETIPNSTEVIYHFEFSGLHFKLADGSWLISMAYHFVPMKGDAVNVEAAKEVNLATLTADAKAAHEFDAVKSASKSLAVIAPEQQERSTQTMNEVVPVIMQLQLSTDSLAIAAVLLQRAGWDDANDLCLAIADIRARNYWQIRPWIGPDMVFDPTGEYSQAKAEEDAWIKSHSTFTSEPPAVALRRAVFRVFRAQISMNEPEDALLPIDVAAAIAKAAVDEKDPQKNAARIDAQAAGAKLPVAPVADADLAIRLQSWEARPRVPKMVVTSPNGGNPSISTSFIAAEAAYVPAKADMEGLVILLMDERPSRFVDFSGSRTLGDNAWRALAELLKADPRTLAGYPTDHPWTKEERQIAAKAVQTWWKAHRAEYVQK